MRDAHVGYISWEHYEAHLAQLAANSQTYAPQRLNPPREEPALLQGIVSGTTSRRPLPDDLSPIASDAVTVLFWLARITLTLVQEAILRIPCGSG